MCFLFQNPLVCQKVMSQIIRGGLERVSVDDV
jgi:hypothetical protein